MLSLYSLDTFCISSLSHVNQVYFTVTVVCRLSAVIHIVGFSGTVTGIHLDSDELIGNRVRERNVHKEMVKDAYPYAPQVMKAVRHGNLYASAPVAPLGARCWHFL